jgi:hypothetical protein
VLWFDEAFAFYGFLSVSAMALLQVRGLSVKGSRKRRVREVKRERNTLIKVVGQSKSRILCGYQEYRKPTDGEVYMFSLLLYPKPPLLFSPHPDVVKQPA